MDVRRRDLWFATGHRSVFTGIYGTDRSITEMLSRILYLTQQSNMTINEFMEALWNSTLCFKRIYGQFFLNWILVEGIHGLTRHWMFSNWTGRHILLFVIFQVTQRIWSTFDSESKRQKLHTNILVIKTPWKHEASKELPKVNSNHQHWFRLDESISNTIYVNSLLTSDHNSVAQLLGWGLLVLILGRIGRQCPEASHVAEHDTVYFRWPLGVRTTP